MDHFGGLDLLSRDPSSALLMTRAERVEREREEKKNVWGKRKGGEGWQRAAVAWLFALSPNPSYRLSLSRRCTCRRCEGRKKKRKEKEKSRKRERGKGGENAPAVRNCEMLLTPLNFFRRRPSPSRTMRKGKREKRGKEEFSKKGRKRKKKKGGREKGGGAGGSRGSSFGGCSVNNPLSCPSLLGYRPEDEWKGRRKAKKEKRLLSREGKKKKKKREGGRGFGLTCSRLSIRRDLLDRQHIAFCAEMIRTML